MTKKVIRALAFLAIVAALLMGVGAVWLTGEVLMFPLGVMPIALTGSGIVAYYELQTNRRLAMLEKAKRRQKTGEEENECSRAA